MKVNQYFTHIRTYIQSDIAQTSAKIIDNVKKCVNVLTLIAHVNYLSSVQNVNMHTTISASLNDADKRWTLLKQK